MFTCIAYVKAKQNTQFSAYKHHQNAGNEVHDAEYFMED